MPVELIDCIYILGLSILIVFVLYFPGIKHEINMGDEGYLWFGTLEILKGKVPIRDFRAYDPLRYYWCSIWMYFFGRGLFSLRLCLMLTQMIGLAFGMIIIYTATKEWSATLLSGLLISMWMYPRHKQIDVMTSILVTLFAVLLVNSPTSLQYFISGIVVGVSFLVGLNHFLYAVFSFGLLLLIMSKHEYGLAYGESVYCFTQGFILVLLVVFIFFMFFPGYIKAYWKQKILRILKRKSTNLKLTIPYIWNDCVPQLSNYNNVAQKIVKVGYTIFPVIYGTVLLYIFWKKDPVSVFEWELIAVTTIGSTYFHHAIARADFSHFSQAISPFLILIVLLLYNSPLGWFILLFFLSISFWYIYMPQGSSVQSILFSSKKTITYERGSLSLQLTSSESNFLSNLFFVIEKYSNENDAIVVLPTLAMIYPLFNRTSAVYDIFCVYPATSEEEYSMLDEIVLSRSSLVIIRNNPLDGRDELRFSNTHPIVWKYLNEEFYKEDTRESLSTVFYVFTKSWD